MASIEATSSLLGNSSASSASTEPRFRHRQKQEQLTVNMKTKIEREMEKSKTFIHRPSRGTVALKWVSSVGFGLILLFCVIESKLSVVAISSKMRETKEHRYVRFVMLFLLALIPNVVNFLRGVWRGAFRDDLPWPGRKAMVMGLGVSLLESIGLCLFMFHIPGLPGLTQPSHVVLLMNCVHLCPAVYNIWRAVRRVESGTRMASITQNVFAILFLVAGVIITIILVLGDVQLRDMWSVPVAVVCLSLAWTPAVQKILLNPGDLAKEGPPIGLDDPEALYPNGNQTPSYQNTTSTTYMSQTVITDVSINMRHLADQRSAGDQDGHDDREPATWKLTIYMSFLKIIFTTIISAVLFFVLLFDDKPSLSDFGQGWSGWGGWTSDSQPGDVYYFFINAVGGAVGYLVAFIACTTCMQRLAFSIPLLLATPVTLLLLLIPDSCHFIVSDATSTLNCGGQAGDRLTLIILAGAFLVLSQVISVGWLHFMTNNIVMQKEGQLFWVPMYNSVLLEQWLVLVRKNTLTDELHVDPTERARKSKIIICTTMYREADYEMRQLLQSIQKVNIAQSDGQRHFESHIFFDGAVKEANPTKFVLQLVSLVEDTLGLKPENASKIMTPYGMTLAWKMNTKVDSDMVLRIHLKDNMKVKNKKRWSQVMYMSYVIDFLMKQMDDATLDETYILTTDADVSFTPDSVEALLDLMTRDRSVGAVCARTHPLGTGPLVWYQTFEYAIGHWFQKAAEHVIGSVLCSPGCFSVYRCKALLDILPQYATNVEHAFDFLIKDMGEDRWMCTLMVQSGWRIEYCAASENSTHCPEDFDEFFKQRRRWVASTLANLMLLIREWSIVAKLNHRVSLVFYVYQMLLLVATLIGPSSVILVVSGGLVYAWDISSVDSVIIQVIACIGYTLACLFTKSNTQLGIAKLMTFLYAVIMTVVMVGTAIQVANDFSTPEPPSDVNGTTTARPSNISPGIEISTTTAYLGTLIALFLVTALLHLRECVYLLHGIWYLLFLPSGYLILTIYSICNITDRTWGTREEKSDSVVTSRGPWYRKLEWEFQRIIKAIFFCCFKEQVQTSSKEVQTEQVTVARHSSVDGDAGETAFEESISHRYKSMDARLSCVYEAANEENAGRHVPGDSDDEEDQDQDVPIPVKEWLPRELQQYVSNFTNNGFDDTRLISGMTERELKDIGIKRKGVKRYLIEEIRRLPDFEIEAEVPENASTWLDAIGLPGYKSNFQREHIKTPADMEILKSFGRSEIEKELKITKTGHIKRLLKAIRELRNPTQSERRIMDVRKGVDKAMRHDLRKVNLEEHDFWENLKKTCLLPQSTAYGLEEDLKSRLGDLRNKWLMVFAVSNTLWLVLIATLANKGQLLMVLGSNPVGLFVLVLFSLVLIIQFLAMLVHRLATLTHFLGRAPYRYGDTFNSSWTFNDRDSQLNQEEMLAAQQKKRTNEQAKERMRNPKPRQRRDKSDDRRPLLGGSQTEPKRLVEIDAEI